MSGQLSTAVQAGGVSLVTHYVPIHYVPVHTETVKMFHRNAASSPETLKL